MAAWVARDSVIGGGEGQVGCLEENTVLAFAEARLSPDSRAAVEAHARDCSHCQALVAAVALNLPTGATLRERPGIAAAAATGARSNQENAQASVPHEPLTPGTSFARYTILGLVGRGGMGEVYAAYDPSLDRRVALKVLSSATGVRSARGHERLLREAQVTAGLSHPNVVVVHDVGSFEGQMYIAMEFVDGSTLGAWVAERPRTWEEILGIFVQAAKGLGAAHSEGLVHRDFKPQNVMVSKGGIARVMDFALARRIDELEGSREGEHGPQVADHSLTKTGELLGTPLYMAPEQFVRARVDARTDQFSFCVALYWALCGVHPFGGGSGAELVRNLARGQVIAPAKKVAAPARIQRALVRGLSADPEARWPSMDALVTELLRDPRRQLHRLGWAMFAAAGAIAIGLAAGQVSRRSRAVCSSGAAHLAGVWETVDWAGPTSRRARIEAAISASGASEPAQTWNRISSLLDRYASKWVAAYRDACEATHVRAEQSEEILDLRMTCLNDNLDSARVLTDLIAAGDRAVIDHAVEAAGSLEDLSTCSAAAQVRSGLRPPRDPLLRRAVEESRRKLKEGDALRQAGEFDRAVAVADAVFTRSDVASYCPVQAEALLLKGLAQWITASKAAVVSLERAVNTGERCGHDRVVASAMGGLVFLYAYSDWRAAERWATLADAVLKRMGGDPILEGWLANNLGSLRYEQGRWEEGRKEEERAIALKEGALGEDNIDVGISQSNLAEMLTMLHRYDDALVAIESALTTGRKWLLADSFYIGNSLANKGKALLALGRLVEADTCFRQAWMIFEAKLSADNPRRLEPLRGLADVSLKRDDVREAVSTLERVVDSGQRFEIAPLYLAPAQFDLARALDQGNRDPLRARSLARRAAAAFASQPTFEPQRREVEAWLDEHRGVAKKPHGG
jgi:tetratricopeptide (TPR) repeat protein